MRYFSELSYLGTRYHGWQKQLNAPSVQETLESAFSTILGCAVEITGCGRTDAGVHASQYFIHFDYEGDFPQALLKRANRILPPDVALRRIFEVPEQAHARFDAVYRSYEYRIVFDKNPFETYTAWHFPFFEKLNLERVSAAAALLLSYQEFAPFCKTHSDAQTMLCGLSRSEWHVDAAGRTMTYHIGAKRFLRGMVRLVVGMCLNVGLGKTDLEEVRHALDRQIPLRQSWSVPPQGLCLTEVRYPFV